MKSEESKISTQTHESQDEKAGSCLIENRNKTRAQNGSLGYSNICKNNMHVAVRRTQP